MFQLNLSNTHIHRRSEEYFAVYDALDSLNSSRKDKLENRLLKFFDDHRVTESNRIKFQDAFDDISKTIKQCFPNVIVCLYGSHINGLSNKDSDLDITILFYEGKYFTHLQRYDQIEKLEIIRNHLDEKYLNVFFISKAKIPIVKFKTETGVNVDISVDNFPALKTTDLIKKYIKLDSRVIVLGQLLKHVVKFYKIGGAYGGYLSSFGYMLMLIHYLQTKGILPILRKNIEFSVNSYFYDCNEVYPTRKFIEASRNAKESGIVDLWIGFFKYYTMKFDVSNVVSITHPSLSSKHDKCWDSYLSIESPLDSDIDVASHIPIAKALNILDSFTDVLKQRGDIDKIIF